MIGLNIKVTLDGKTIDEIEIRDLRPGTLVKKITYEGEAVTSSQQTPKGWDNVYREIVDQYTPILMSNEKLVFSTRSFVYSENEKK